jgi:hypothetical protein
MTRRGTTRAQPSRRGAGPKKTATGEAEPVGRRRGLAKYWSQRVTETSNALDLESGVFTWPSPGAIARSLKRSAELSTRRKAGAFQSAMSMLNFYINRAGRNLGPKRRRTLERAKDELRNAFGRTS